MSENEIFNFIAKCSTEERDAPIKISDNQTLKSSLNAMINKSHKQIDIFIRFIGDAKNPVFEMLKDATILKNLKEFLSLENTKLRIVSNEQKKIRKSDFYREISSFSGVSLRALSAYIVNEKTSEEVLDSFVLCDPKSLIIGTFDYSEGGRPSYANFGDSRFYSLLLGLFSNLSVATAGSRGAIHEL